MMCSAMWQDGVPELPVMRFKMVQGLDNGVESPSVCAGEPLLLPQRRVDPLRASQVLYMYIYKYSVPMQTPHPIIRSRLM
jgi:hypothetical protein